MEDTQPFGLWLKRRRKERDLTQQELAQQAGYSVQTIEKIESGARRPSKEVAARLADCLAIPAEERVSFVQWARGGARGAGPAPGRRPPPHNLPAPPNSFVGRARELVLAGQLLGRAGVRLLTLTGPPGIGKTRLALEVARAVLDEFAQGVTLVSLAVLRDPGLVVSAIAGALGVREAPQRPLTESLQEALRDQHRLLVLDNFEQILAAAPQVGELLAAAPGLKVLVTSRTALHLYGEHELRLTPLALPDGRRLAGAGTVAGRLLRYAAVALFVERAQAVQPDFALAADNAGAVAAVCRRLDGLPLAIELAAARTRTLPPPLLLAGLSGAAGREPLHLLTGGARDVPARQRTLRAAIAWSYDLLNRDEQQLFRRLAVFAGGCTAEAAAAVVKDTEPQAGRSPSAPIPTAEATAARLAALVDKNLLQLVEGSRGATAEAATRYQMLETIREYGLEQLAANRELEAARRQHASYYLALAERAAPALQKPAGAEWIERLEEEHDNLRATLGWTQEQEEGELALRLGGALWQFWIRGGHLTEGRQWLAGMLAHPMTATPTSAARRADALLGAGAMAWHQDDYAAAGMYWEEALVLYRQLDNPGGVATVFNCRGALAYAQGDMPTARTFYEESLGAARAVGNQHLAAGLLHNLAGVALDQGDPAAAQAFEEESLALGKALGYKEIQAFARAGLGAAAQYQGDYAAAYTHYTAALALRQELGDKLQTAELRTHLGFVAHHRGDDQQARTLLTENLALSLETGVRRDTATCLVGLAMLNAAHGQPERAARLLGAADALHQALGRPVMVHAQADYEQTLAAARAQLSTDEFAAAWAAGQALPVEQAAAEALAPPSSNAPARRKQPAAKTA